MNSKFLKQITGITAAAIFLMFGGCKKFLDQQPITDVGPELVFKDVTSTTKALAGVYSR